jgi:hypothetical protein
MMTVDEFGKLLKQINAADSRFKIDDKGKVGMWWHIAQEARWSYADASAAVVAFFAMPAEPNREPPWISPGNVTYLIRSRRGGPPRIAGELTRGRPSSPEHRARLREQLAAELEARNVSTSVKARQPWHDGPVRGDVVDDGVALPPGDGQRALLSVIRGGKRAEGPSGAFSGARR